MQGQNGSHSVIPKSNKSKRNQAPIRYFLLLQMFPTHFAEIASPLYDLLNAEHLFQFTMEWQNAVGHTETSYDFPPLSQIPRNGQII